MREKEIGRCAYCGRPFDKTRASHLYCSDGCGKKANRVKLIVQEIEKETPPTRKVEVSAYKSEAPESKYCPIGCQYYDLCGKRKGDEFEYITSGGGRWRALRGC